MLSRRSYFDSKRLTKLPRGLREAPLLHQCHGQVIVCLGIPGGESERILPEILEKFETVLEEAGLSDDAISLRITGCPNGCARPYLAEIGFVAKAPNKYALYLGARYNGTRLNRLVSPSITPDDAVTLLTPIIKRYALERQEGEGFGDFCDRVILPEDATFHSVGTQPELASAK